MFIGEILVIISIVLVVTQAAKLYPTLDVPSNVIFQVAVDYLPLAFGALVMCACMAFIVTTADSYLLSSATNLTNDIYVKYIRKDATDKQKMLVLRGYHHCVQLHRCGADAVFPHCAVPADDGLHHVRRRHHPGDPVRPLLQEGDARRRHGRYPGGRSGHDHLTLMGTPYGIQCAIVAVPASVIAILIVSAVTRCNDPKRSLEALYQDN